jgi:hypothetical protein
LEQLYSSKTDEELLAMSADYASLLEEAKPILARELGRRNLDPVPVEEEQISSLGHLPNLAISGCSGSAVPCFSIPALQLLAHHP